MKRYLVLFLILSFVSIINAQENRTITVTGTGTIYDKPDIARINVAVVVRHSDISQALKESKEKIERIENLFKIYNLPKENHYTGMFNVYQENAYNKDMEDVFVVRNSINIEFRDLDKVGQFIEDLIKNGANEFFGLSFDIQNKKELRSKARKKAIDDAIKKAKEMAKYAGIKTGKIISIKSGANIAPYYADKFSSRTEMSINEPESISVNESVTIIFEITD